MKKNTITTLLGYINCKKITNKEGEMSLEEVMAHISHYMHNRGTVFEQNYLKGAELYNNLLGRDIETPISDDD